MQLIATINNNTYQIGGDVEGAGGSGYDAVFRLLKTYDENNTIISETLELLEGDFSSCVEKIENDELLDILFYGVEKEANSEECTYTLYEPFQGYLYNGESLKIHHALSPYNYIYWDAEEFYGDQTPDSE